MKKLLDAIQKVGLGNIWVPIGTILALFTSFLFAGVIFKQSVFVSAIFALFAVMLTIVVIAGATRAFARDSDLEALMRPSRAPTASERRKESRERLERMQDELAKKTAKKSRVDFYTKGLIVLVYMMAYAGILNLVFDVYPSQAFFLPFWMLVTIWVLLLLFLPRTIIIVILLALTGVSAIVSVMGPTVILQFLPYLMTMPMFMFMNFFMLFGPLLIINIQQMKVVKPGESKWGRTFDDVRGQDEAKKQVLTALKLFQSQEKNPLFREKGIMMFGPPGVGKTLTAEAVATEMVAPMILTNGAAFASPFMGVGIIAMLYLFMRAESLAAEYGGCVIFIDEAEQLLRRRSGVMGGSDNNSAGQAPAGFYGMFEYDQFGQTGDLVFDSQEALAYTWQQKYPRPPDRHPIMTGVGMGMGMGGAGMALPVYLAKLDGVPSPPMFERIWRSKLNQVWDIAFVPHHIKLLRKKIILRIDPAKPVIYNILHMAATNMPHMIDPAILRPGRFGLKVHFVLPGEEERADIAELYFDKSAERKLLHPELVNNRQRLQDFAQASVGFSPADIMQAVYAAPSLRSSHINRLKDLKERLEAGEELSERDARFWKRFRHEMDESDWDRPWATWDSLMESLRTIRYGMAMPTRTSPKHRETTAYHEFAGHLLPLFAFAREYMKPTILSIMPRGQAVGMVAHVPIEEYDPQPQRFWEAMLRVMVGSVVAERLFFGESMPGVVIDLETATRTAANMAGQFGMVPRKCSPRDRKRYIEVGKTLLSSGGLPSMGFMGTPDPMSMAAGKGDSVALFLGQAFVDTYRLVRKNRDFIPAIVERLLAEDEIMGTELEELWGRLGETVKPLTLAADRGWPDKIIAPATPFYQGSGKEGR